MSKVLRVPEAFYKFLQEYKGTKEHETLSHALMGIMHDATAYIKGPRMSELTEAPRVLSQSPIDYEEIASIVAEKVAKKLKEM